MAKRTSAQYKVNSINGKIHSLNKHELSYRKQIVSCAHNTLRASIGLNITL